MTLQANGGARAEVAVGQPVRFTGTITAPPGTGMVVKAEWDFEGKGDYPVDAAVSGKSAMASVTASYTLHQTRHLFCRAARLSQRADAAGHTLCPASAISPARGWW